MSTASYYCAKCKALLDRSQVNEQDKTHVVVMFKTEAGDYRTLIHTGLTEE